MISDVIRTVLVVLTIIAQALIVLALIAYATKRWNNHARRSVSFCRRRAAPLAFIVALTSFLGSMSLSQILGWQPCTLCWYQRIAMFPQAIILGSALMTREKKWHLSTAALSIIGILISGYHWATQMLEANVPCSASGPSCAARYIFSTSYITIPFMAMCAFTLILLISINARARS
ncbi:MAG: disulfide bond formation protein B [Nanoarchaeota archaeon]